MIRARRGAARASADERLGVTTGRSSCALALALLASSCGGAAGSPQGPGARPEPGAVEAPREAVQARGPGREQPPNPNEEKPRLVAAPGEASATVPQIVAAPGEASATVPQIVAAPGEASATVPQMNSPVPTALAPRLQALGLDPENLPAIEKLEPRMLRGAMKLIAESLGVKCGDCHEESDFAAPTRRKKIAVRMWDDFVVRLSMADGSPLFCDSCHQGRVEQLDRHDLKNLSAWMDENFVAKLARKDGQPETCETCHVDMNMRFLVDWGR